MKIYTEQSLRNFGFWSGAADNVEYLTDQEVDILETLLDDLHPEGIDETELNDLFWHDADVIADWLGFEYFDDIMSRNDQ